MNIQLTISMLVSDRSVTLKKCLNSLKGLLRELSCELIVVFTGEQEETLNIVKQYTDHIIPFKWCNDFSAARNIGLREAKGEWFMYIDDDEWFEDVSEIISFFKTRECDNYQFAFYIQRNYQDWEGKNYADAPIARMYRNSGDLEFISSIHEYISTVGKKPQYFSSYVHHYGYVSDKKGDSPRFTRNIPLLLEEIEKNPENRKHYMQIAQEYNASGEFDKGEDACRRGIAIAEKSSDSYTSDHWMMVHLPVFLSLQGKDEEALSETERFLEMKKIQTSDLAKVYLYSIAVALCLRLKRFEKGVYYVRRFHKTWKSLHSGKVDFRIYQHGNMNLSNADQKLPETYIYGLDLAVNVDNFEAVTQILKWIPWSNVKDMQPYYPLLEKWKNTFPKKEEEILKSLAAISENSCYLLLQKALYAENQNHIPHLKKFFEKCQKAYAPEDSEISSQIVRLGLRNELDVTPMLKVVPFEYWNRYAFEAARNTSYKKMDEELAKIKNCLHKYPIHYSLFEQSFLEKQMTLGWLNRQELITLLEKYCKIVIDYYKMLYKENCFTTEEQEFLPGKCNFALLIQKAIENFKKNEIDSYIRNLRTALHVCPMFSSVIRKLLKDFEKNSNQTNSIEFAQLGAQVKEQVKILISKKQYLEAYSILMKLMQMMPDDTELLKLKQQIITGAVLPAKEG